MAPLVKNLEFPLPPSDTNVLGIFQSDIIIRTALTIALADMRANPWLLDYVFASLTQDSLTSKSYGEKAVKAAKEWFLKTDIPVYITPIANEFKVPSISITLVQSSEAAPETTLGDIHSTPDELNSTVWPTIVENYAPYNYNFSTGTLYFSAPPPLGPNGETIALGVGMSIVDNNGNAYPILSVIDPQTVTIAPNTIANFSNAALKSQNPTFVTHIESCSYNESYRIGVHAPAEPTTLIWLHSVLVFALLRYKQLLIEARGFERTVTQSSDLVRDEQFEAEQIFSRYITITGYVRHYWPKLVAPRIDSLATQIQVEGAGTIAITGVDPETQIWVGDLDSDNDPDNDSDD